MANETTPVFDKNCYPFTGHCAAAVTGGRLLMVDAVAPVDGCHSVKVCTAGALALGIAGRDAGIAGKVPVIQEGIVPVTAGATVAVGDLVMSDATGRVITATATNVIVGVALTGNTVGLPVDVLLLRSGAKVAA